MTVTIGLTAVKFLAAKASGSVGVFSEGIHSLLDLVSAAVAFFTIREAAKDADRDHPYGHGKIETLSSLFESLLLLAAAALIVFEGIEHIFYPQPLRYQGLAIGVIVASMLVSYLVYRHNARAASITESSAIRVNALHFLSDVVASAGVLAGLLIIHLTGWLIIDPLMAFAVAAYILVISASQVKGALQELTDTTLPDQEVARIHEILEKFAHKTINSHDLRTRKSGATRHIDFHLVVCGHLTVNESHSVCDQIESAIVSEYPRASVNIHVEPCEHGNTECQVVCEIYQKRKGERNK